MSQFHTNLIEIMSDLQTDIDLDNVSPETEAAVRVYIIEVFNQNISDFDGMMNGLLTLMFMMFLAGREHAIRGYPAPMAREGFEPLADTPKGFVTRLDRIWDGPSD